VAAFEEEVEIITDSADYDWTLFFEIAYDEGR
jgi:hypothetical protein